MVLELGVFVKYGKWDLEADGGLGMGGRCVL